jgi:hypothetical protein
VKEDTGNSRVAFDLMYSRVPATHFLLRKAWYSCESCLSCFLTAAIVSKPPLKVNTPPTVEAALSLKACLTRAFRSTILILGSGIFANFLFALFQSPPFDTNQKKVNMVRVSVLVSLIRSLCVLEG